MYYIRYEVLDGDYVVKVGSFVVGIWGDWDGIKSLAEVGMRWNGMDWLIGVHDDFLQASILTWTTNKG